MLPAVEVDDSSICRDPLSRIVLIDEDPSREAVDLLNLVILLGENYNTQIAVSTRGLDP